MELSFRPVQGAFNVVRLRAIHKYIFQDVFPWAGEFRVVNIQKGNTRFGPAIHLVAALDDLFGKLKREDSLAHLSRPHFIDRAAFYLGELNSIHPFREGNGRTQREFIRQLAVQAGHPLSWAGFTQAEMVAASILAHSRGDTSALASILTRAIEQAQ